MDWREHQSGRGKRRAKGHGMKWCAALQDGLMQRWDTQLLPFWLCSHQHADILFFFNSGNYSFRLRFYGNTLVRSLCVHAPDWF